MMLLRGGPLVIFIAFIGVTYSMETTDLSTSEGSAEETDLEYRPWQRNGTSAPWISLDGMGVSTINSVLQLNVNDLRWLVMDNNNIQMIPSNAFEILRNLSYLSLVKNRIGQFETSAFSYLEKLQVLDLDENPISENLDACKIFGALHALRSLYLRKCNLLSFDVRNCMENLSHLYLSGNRIQAFFVKNESPVTHLYLNDNELRRVSLSGSKSLVYLDLSRNWLNNIASRSMNPDAYDSASQIDRWGYYWGHNSGSTLYLEGAPALEYLDVSSNKISRIEPDTFLEIETLISVDLTDNKIQEIYHGTFGNLLQLEEILLDSNEITKIHYRAFVNLPSLKIISLKNNRITDVSEDAFTKLNSNAPDLHLFLDNNRIHTLKRGSFMGINGLKHIGLSNNRIKTISSQTFVNLPNLESVLIEDQSDDTSVDRSLWGARVPINGIIESDAFFNLSNLTSITIRGNLFAVIEAQAFHTLPALRMLDLSNNSIESLSPTAFYDLPELEDLYLENNLLSNIDPQTFPKELKQLNLAMNPLSEEFNCLHVGELDRLEKLNVSGVIETFKINDVISLPENLTVVVGK